MNTPGRQQPATGTAAGPARSPQHLTSQPHPAPSPAAGAHLRGTPMFIGIGTIVVIVIIVLVVMMLRRR